ncbi:MAG: response regulator [Verrucomicrobia bacterium]|nr:response regulator [Verrucomicrobiota bacterium]
MGRFNVMVLEDAIVTSVVTSRALELDLPDAAIHRAQSLFEARLLLETYPIHFCILDVQLPDGCGLDLIPDLVAKYPNAGVVIVTASALPAHRDSASAFGVLHFMEKPVDPRWLGRLAREYRDSLASDGATSDTSFAASLKRLTVTDIVQLKCLARATVGLAFSLRDSRRGCIYLEEGEVVHAEVAAHPKTEAKQGVPAFREILGWRGGKVEEINSLAEQRTMDCRWQELLLNTVQWLDESAAPPAGAAAADESDRPPAQS